MAALDLVRRLADQKRAPRLVVVENVSALAASGGGRELAVVAGSLTASGYRVGALAADARLFVPQSRLCLFVVAAHADLAVPAAVLAAEPAKPWHPAALAAASRKFRQWVWWAMPAPARRRTDLADLLDEDADWHASSITDALLALMPPRDAERLASARAKGTVLPTPYRRRRPYRM